jgi:putative methyltransferase (TIGR04325 family)
MVTSPWFLKYMNHALELYEAEDDAISIHGYVYPLERKLPETFFLKGADCWGWATWKRGWDLFERDGTKLLNELEQKQLIHEFDYNGSYSYSGMLRDQIAGRNNSWAVRWYASAFLKNKYTLYPGKSLVENIGLDDSGTHCSDSEEYSVELATKEVQLEKIEPKVCKEAFEAFTDYFSSGPSLASKIKRKLKSSIKSSIFSVKTIAKDWLPPIILRFLKSSSSPWSGDYSTWEEAERKATGYDQDNIIEIVRKSTAKVRDGVFPYERDSVLFDKIEYSWPLLSALMMAAAQNEGRLNVIDFGGALGSSWYQNRKFLESLKEHSWNIVEQEKFVDLGSREFENSYINFYPTLNSCFESQRIDLVLFSSVLQYLKDPYLFIGEVVKNSPDYIVLDRLSIVELDRDLITIQNVPKQIYKGIYPCRFFNRQNILEKFLTDYELLEEFVSFIPNETVIDGKYKSIDKGFIFKRKM